jgi:hypothetical protein
VTALQTSSSFRRWRAEPASHVSHVAPLPSMTRYLPLLVALGLLLSSCRGSEAYSNLGVALLGRLLEEVAEASWEDLVRERVLNPLGLDDTRPTPEVLDHPELTRGHRENLRPASSWILDGYAPAGGLTSTPEDMIRLVEAAMAPGDGPLRDSLEPAWLALDGRRGAGLGWALSTVDQGPSQGAGPEDERMVWHNGRTGGYYAFVGLLPGSGRGVVLLTNTSRGGDSFAISLLTGEPEIPPRGVRWMQLALTLLFVGAAPVALYRARRALVGTGGSSTLAPPSGSTNRGGIHLAATGVDGAFFLALAWKLGAWNVVPVGFWWIAVAGSALLLAASLPAASRLPLLPREYSRRRILALAGVAGMTLALGWAVFRL